MGVPRLAKVEPQDSISLNGEPSFAAESAARFQVLVFCKGMDPSLDLMWTSVEPLLQHLLAAQIKFNTGP
jgi:hypothetical protein